MTTSRTMNIDLAKQLDSYEFNLTGLASRQFILEAFTSDLDRVTRAKPFRFRNGVVWLMLLDTRDMLVVHLASWAKGVLQPDDGLIDQLQNHHILEFPRVLPPVDDSVRPDLPDWVKRNDRERREREHATCFNRLFPKAGSHPSGSDFNDLRQAFSQRRKPLKEDRDWNRAHPFEKVTGTTKMLNVAELRSWIDYAERFMNDLTMVARHYTFDYREMNVPNAADFAPDLVDAMLIGEPERVARLRGKSTRDELYARLHEQHDARPPKDGDFFNDFHQPTADALPATSTDDLA